jgi:cytochrome oxidase Cu insertion factor (SCO1/SenC/PrrC family)
LSISVDPERDTPEVLARHAREVGARPESWKWLTGPEREVERAVVRGFHVALAKVQRPATDVEVHAAAVDIFHGEKLVLVDGRARIRGFYDADDRERLLADAWKIEHSP